MIGNGQLLGTGTGFVVKQSGAPFLISNYHVIAGRDPNTGQSRHRTAATPDTMLIRHLREGPHLTWEDKPEPVVDVGGNALWFEHPILGRKVDVVALPLRNLGDVQLVPYDHDEGGPRLKVTPTSDLSVVGFPFGLTGGAGLAIWTRAFVASEPAVDFDGEPVFLVDARTRPGQSGSPVIAYDPGGGFVQYTDGNSSIGGASVVNLLGVYSGRINEQSDLGKVWKTRVIGEILAARRCGTASLTG